MRKTIVGVATLCLVLASGASAQETARVSVSPESKLWVDGTSSLHGWTCRTQSLDATIELDAKAAAQLTTAAPSALRRVQVKVPVKSLKCGHGGMDNNLYKALNADAAPEISYIMASFEPALGEANEAFGLKTVGSLTIAGTERRITMDVSATRLADGSIKTTGVVPIKMTEFGVKPPTAMFGRIKTGDEVKVNFELIVGAKAIAAATKE
ncbi:MAG TPA: YceI family protein [Gemmatimonadaceae bacterium]